MVNVHYCSTAAVLIVNAITKQRLYTPHYVEGAVQASYIPSDYII